MKNKSSKSRERKQPQIKRNVNEREIQLPKKKQNLFDFKILQILAHIYTYVCVNTYVYMFALGLLKRKPYGTLYSLFVY